ncbi:uncharacterized protein PV09_05820 [Verruconis gallopava]|uniref:Uncharacterized protein n=1 Tax=Verruconis gallopava TaxID=253628 RepID=A0A0D2A7K8_9PEZI|nr:uncharacterized protein PV09_05820 [Verruconis gallopava]KIW02748.1 hypothetical protein PV09_05820 [Verruconis gallopava]
MGDIAPDGLNEESQCEPQDNNGEIKVLVTGYAPFHVRFPVNSSWSIASTLPEHLPATTTCPRIKLVVPTEPIQVAYNTVVEWEENSLASTDYDIILHIGLAAGRKFFTMERQSQREPYWEKKDVKGEVFSREMTEKLWPNMKFPMVLKPTFDCGDVWLRWRANVDKRLDVRPSDDPGNYLCGFIYYYSMAWFWARASKERPVMFLHVPDLPTEELVEGGREVTIGLIRALVESREKKGVFDPLAVDESGLKSNGHFTSPGFLQRPSSFESSCTEECDMAWTYQK